MYTHITYSWKTWPLPVRPTWIAIYSTREQSRILFTYTVYLNTSDSTGSIYQPGYIKNPSLSTSRAQAWTITRTSKNEIIFTTVIAMKKNCQYLLLSPQSYFIPSLLFLISFLVLYKPLQYLSDLSPHHNHHNINHSFIILHHRFI